MLLTSFVGIALAAMSSAPSKEPKFSESPHLVQSMQLNEYLLGEFVRAENQEQNDMALVDRIFVCRESDHGSMLRVSYVGEDIIVTLDR
jgi:hypothetical protein